MNRRYILMIGIVAIGAPVLALWSADEAPIAEDEAEPAGTQIVVQWLDDSPPDSSTRADPLLALLDERSENLYVVDSFDLGGGTMNVFLYSVDSDKAVRQVVQLFEENLLPPGMRVGVADLQGGNQSDRTYHPVYPDGLEDFKLIYPSQNALRNSGR